MVSSSAAAMTAHPELVETRHGVVLAVHVQPGAGRDRIVGRHGDACKVSVSAPPVDGKANAAVEKLLARVFGVPAAHVEVIGGHSSRRKRVALGGLRLVEAMELLDRAYEG